MVKFSALRVVLRLSALLFCAVAIIASANPASAKPYKGYHKHHAQSAHGVRHVKRHSSHRKYVKRYRGGRHYSRAQRVRHGAHYSRSQRVHYATPRSQRARYAAPQQEQAVASVPQSGFGSTNIVAEARRYIGGNPTGRSRLWCARFMNMVLQRSGHKGTGSDMARSFASYGQRISGPQVGAIAVMSRGKRGGHVGVVSGIDAKGNPIVVSGNHGRRVAESVYPRGRVYAYVMPGS